MPFGKWFSRIRLCLLCVACPPVFAVESCDPHVDISLPIKLNRAQSSSICVGAGNGQRTKKLALILEAKRGELYVASAGRRYLVERIGRQYHPSLVGTEDRVRFLPLRLQAYAGQGKWLFVSSRRSSGGNGGGQCGSGSEDFLNVLDVTRKVPLVVGRVAIGSCLDGIELQDTAEYGDLRSFQVEDGQLHIDFLFYRGRNEDHPAAVLGPDFGPLRFIQNQ